MFEIKVALLGHVSVGKTTVLNALFRDKYSEVTMSRTTAAVNRFYVSAKSPTDAAGGLGKGAPSSMSTSPSLPPVIEPASSVLQQITSANKRLRVSNTMEEQNFHVQLEEPLCEMRGDTQLVVIDIPGLNEQGSREKYKTYVSNRWKTWDCVVVIMDAVQGVNSDEQVQLLETVKNHYDTKKKIPIIILCNKFDDPEDEEKAVIVDEVQHKVESVFHVSCRRDALENLLLMMSHEDHHHHDDNNSCASNNTSVFPVFIPIAAAKAFLYRAASRLSLEEFQQEKHQQRFNIDELVRDEVGRFQWKKLTPEERYAVAYRVISDPTQYQERLASTNFDKFLTALSRSVGGETVQRRLIHKQLLVTLNDITLEEFLMDKVQAIADKHKVIGNPSGHIRNRFWVLFNASLEKAFEKYRKDMDLSGLSKAADLLANYSKLSDSLTPVRTDEARDVFLALKRIFKFQCQVMEEKARVWSIQNAAFMDRWNKVGTNWTHHGTGKTVPVQDKVKAPPSDSPFHWDQQQKSIKVWKNKFTKVDKNGPVNPGVSKVTWENLSPFDWNTMIGSVLLASYSRHFVEQFGSEKVRLEYLSRYGSFATYFTSTYCVNCISDLEKKARNDLALYTEENFENGKGVPAHPTGYRAVFQVKLPNALSDPAHWGHVGWRFCNFAESANISIVDLPLESNTDIIDGVVYPKMEPVVEIALPEDAAAGGADDDGDY